MPPCQRGSGESQTAGTQPRELWCCGAEVERDLAPPGLSPAPNYWATTGTLCEAHGGLAAPPHVLFRDKGM